MADGITFQPAKLFTDAKPLGVKKEEELNAGFQPTTNFPSTFVALRGLMAVMTRTARNNLISVYSEETGVYSVADATKEAGRVVAITPVVPDDSSPLSHVEVNTNVSEGAL